IFDVMDVLERAIEVSERTPHGQFFQREIRFELLKATSGSQYPTPHHVAALMAQLAITDQSKTVFDPTAGTGGLLVAAHRVNENVQLFGVDFDAQMVGLASANLILNSAVDATMQVEQVLNPQRYQNDASRYDSIIMNPPFGG